MKTPFFCLLLAFCCVLETKAQKVAHLNYDSLINLMPETKTASEAANNYLKGLEAELVAMQTELESKYKDYQAKEAGMSEFLKKTKQEDLQQLQKRIQEFQQKAEADFRIRQNELTTPIMMKAKKGIEMAAKDGGFRYVVDTSPGRTSILFSEPGDDLLQAVKKKLDAMPLAKLPGTVQQEIPNSSAPAPKGR
jgi:outer membrane protein